MKRIFWILILAAGLVLGRNLFEASDVAKLSPVEVIRISRTEDAIRVETDTGAKGHGETLEEAFCDLQETCAGDIFLDTADYVLVSDDCRDLLQPLLFFLRPACRVCREEGRVDLRAVAPFLDTHRPGITLMEINEDTALPVLRLKEGELELVS